MVDYLTRLDIESFAMAVSAGGSECQQSAEKDHIGINSGPKQIN